VVAVEGYKQEGLISETSYKALLKIAYDQKSKDLEQELLRHQQRMSSSAAQHGLAARPSASPFSPAMLFDLSDQAAAPSCQQTSASLLVDEEQLSFKEGAAKALRTLLKVWQNSGSILAAGIQQAWPWRGSAVLQPQFAYTSYIDNSSA
jgi:hypothetical protein